MNRLKDIDVYILCGGKGKRLQALSGDIPKPLMRVAGRPFIDRLIGFLAAQGFRRVLLGIGYHAAFFEKHYSRRRKRLPQVVLIKERTPAGTGGALALAKKHIRSATFFVLNGDSFCDFNAPKLLDAHRRKKALATILLKKVKDGSDYGAITLAPNLRIVRFNEKQAGVKDCYINAGVYVFDQKVFGLMPERRKFSLEKDVFQRFTRQAVFGYPVHGKSFIDIGTPERFRKAAACIRSIT
jgi:NDP-sugar pyrophosphorylase family protein